MFFLRQYEDFKFCTLTNFLLEMFLSLQKFAVFSRKTCAVRFLMSKAFQKAKFYQNLTSGSKQRFSLFQEKAFIQAFRPEDSGS